MTVLSLDGNRYEPVDISAERMIVPCAWTHTFDGLIDLKYEIDCMRDAQSIYFGFLGTCLGSLSIVVKS